jgi:pimeloyl-ACP methyl ester carboxylesterase
MFRRTSILSGVLVIGVVAALGACTSSSKPSAAKSTAAKTSTQAPVPGSSFVERPAVWTPCPDIAEDMTGSANAAFTFDCATIQVPQDWHSPNNGKTFDIAIVRARSNSQKNRIGSLVVNPGGPGGSGVQLAAGLVDSQSSLALPSAITDRFDIVGFDPRGVGESTEVQCLTPATEDSLFGADPDPATQGDFDAVVALNKAAVAPCLAKYGSELPLFSTEQASRDIDAVRVAVGDTKLTYLGYSYGTLLGATYAQLFPQNVRALVLDGTIDPKQDAVQRSQSQAGGFEHAFNDFSTWCKANASKCPIASDPLGEVMAAVAKGRTSPVTGPDGRRATAGWIITGVSEAMYTQSEWPTMATAIAQLKSGTATGIFQLADEYAERSPNGQYSNLFDANDAVNCADLANEPTVAQVRTYQLAWRVTYPLFGAALATGMLTCAVGVWPGARDPYPTGAATGAPPIVLVGTTGDPATPYAQTAKLAAMLGDAHIVTWEGEGHTAYPQTTCIINAVDAYLINLTVPAAGLTCPAKS